MSAADALTVGLPLALTAVLVSVNIKGNSNFFNLAAHLCTRCVSIARQRNISQAKTFDRARCMLMGAPFVWQLDQ